MGYVYLIQVTVVKDRKMTQMLKLGRTVQANPYDRLRRYRNYRLILLLETADCVSLEKELLRHFRTHYTLAQGREYFTGNPYRMKQDFLALYQDQQPVIKDFNPSSLPVLPNLLGRAEFKNIYGLLRDKRVIYYCLDKLTWQTISQGQFLPWLEKQLEIEQGLLFDKTDWMGYSQGSSMTIQSAGQLSVAKTYDKVKWLLDQASNYWRTYHKQGMVLRSAQHYLVLKHQQEVRAFDYQTGRSIELTASLGLLGPVKIWSLSTPEEDQLMTTLLNELANDVTLIKLLIREGLAGHQPLLSYDTCLDNDWGLGRLLAIFFNKLLAKSYVIIKYQDQPEKLVSDPTGQRLQQVTTDGCLIAMVKWAYF